MARPISKKQHPHAAFIDALGGPHRVATLVSFRTEQNVTVHAVWNWTRRGIPAQYRPLLANVAQVRGIKAPQAFIPGV